jgi:hypothetical protein
VNSSVATSNVWEDATAPPPQSVTLVSMSTTMAGVGQHVRKIHTRYANENASIGIHQVTTHNRDTPWKNCIINLNVSVLLCVVFGKAMPDDERVYITEERPGRRQRSEQGRQLEGVA